MPDLLAVPHITQLSSPSEILLYKIYFLLLNGFGLTGSNDAVVAYAGGGQANAYLLTKQYNSIITCASANDSVKCLNALISFQYVIRNSTSTNDAMVYPASGEKFDGLAINEGYPLEAGGQITLTCILAGVWKIS